MLSKILKWGLVAKAVAAWRRYRDRNRPPGGGGSVTTP